MSKIFENEYGMFISHEKFINNVYTAINNSSISYRLNPNLFQIFTQYKGNKTKLKKLITKAGEPNNTSNEESNKVKLKFYKFIENQFLFDTSNLQCDISNKLAIEAADCIQKNLRNSNLDLIGENIGHALIKEINNMKYIFPRNSKFFSKDVTDLNKYLANKKFDFILLDPPWWNKYIRRKRKASSDAYNMIYNHDLKNLPVNNLLAEDGLIAVWCTNSEQNLNALIKEMFPNWNVNFIAKWYWVKITTKGEPVCNFSEPPGKQPYEQLIFGHRSRSFPLPTTGKLLVSVPSAIHSHKPPLVNVLEEFLPKNPECLEIFARYLLPDWTSYGNEVLKLQHESLFV